MANSKAIELYYLNPKYCKLCGAVIQVRKYKNGLAQTKRLDYCSKQCSGTANAMVRSQHYTLDSTSTCEICGEVITNPKRGNGYKVRKRCKAHLYVRSWNGTELESGSTPELKKKKLYSRKVKSKASLIFSSITKGDLYRTSKSNQAARSSIGASALRVYRDSTKPRNCYICSYELHVEVCHIKAIALFGPEALVVDEINNIDNLVTLCPTHHWEFDHGHLSILV